VPQLLTAGQGCSARVVSQKQPAPSPYIPVPAGGGFELRADWRKCPYSGSSVYPVLSNVYSPKEEIERAWEYSLVSLGDGKAHAQTPFMQICGTGATGANRLPCWTRRRGHSGIDKGLHLHYRTSRVGAGFRRQMIAKVFRCSDLELDSDCEYVICGDTTPAVLRYVVEHLERVHHMYPIPRRVMDSVHRTIKEERVARS